MKLSIALLTLAVSANVMAYSITDSTVLTSATPLLSSATTSGELQKAQAAAIINDSQEYFQSGKLSAFLAQKVSEVQTESELSVDEAVDALVQDAANLQ
jgi:hypothetical protein